MGRPGKLLLAACILALCLGGVASASEKTHRGNRSRIYKPELFRDIGRLFARAMYEHSELYRATVGEQKLKEGKARKGKAVPNFMTDQYGDGISMTASSVQGGHRQLTMCWRDAISRQKYLAVKAGWRESAMPADEGPQWSVPYFSVERGVSRAPQEFIATSELEGDLFSVDRQAMGMQLWLREARKQEPWHLGPTSWSEAKSARQIWTNSRVQEPTNGNAILSALAQIESIGRDHGKLPAALKIASEIITKGLPRDLFPEWKELKGGTHLAQTLNEHLPAEILAQMGKTSAAAGGGKTILGVDYRPDPHDGNATLFRLHGTGIELKVVNKPVVDAVRPFTDVPAGSGARDNAEPTGTNVDLFATNEHTIRGIFKAP